MPANEPANSEREDKEIPPSGLSRLSFHRKSLSEGDKALVENLANPQSVSRDRVVEELKNGKREELLPEILKMLRHRKPFARAAAARVLEGSTDDAAYDALKNAKKDKDPAVRLAAIRALRLSYLARKQISNDDSRTSE